MDPEGSVGVGNGTMTQISGLSQTVFHCCGRYLVTAMQITQKSQGFVGPARGGNEDLYLKDNDLTLSNTQGKASRTFVMDAHILRYLQEELGQHVNFDTIVEVFGLGAETYHMILER